MSDLEEQGFLYKPHVVAGRIPTGKAFRYYVNTLARAAPPGKTGAAGPGHMAAHRYSKVEEVMGDASRVLASLCKYAGIVVEPRMDFMFFKEVEFVKLSRTTILVVFVTSSRHGAYEAREHGGGPPVRVVAGHEGLHEREVRRHHRSIPCEERIYRGHGEGQG